MVHIKISAVLILAAAAITPVVPLPVPQNLGNLNYDSPRANQLHPGKERSLSPGTEEVFNTLSKYKEKEVLHSPANQLELHPDSDKERNHNPEFGTPQAANVLLEFSSKEVLHNPPAPIVTSQPQVSSDA